MRNNVAAAAVLVLAAAGIAAGCGDEENGSAGNGTDRAFTQAMVPHHEMAVDMAAVARRRGEHAEVKRLARDIIRAQGSGIATLRRVDRELAEQRVGRGELHVLEHMRGMDQDMARSSPAADWIAVAAWMLGALGLAFAVFSLTARSRL